MRQGEEYYNRFVTAFPTIESLATAEQDAVLKLWEGLGYYSRARNIHHAAQDIMIRFGGQFPDTHKDILSLKGIGPYAAAAIGSFAYGLPYVVVDGNVLRVISRLYGITAPVDVTTTVKDIRAKAQALLETQDAATFNQAIMEFGAMMCTYKNPGCDSCPLIRSCRAYQEEMVPAIPIKSKRIKKTTRYFHFLLLEHNEKLVIEQRSSKGIWQGLYQFPLIEKKEAKDAPSLHEVAQIASINEQPPQVSEVYKQTLTHQYIVARFYKYSCKTVPKEVKMIRNTALIEYAWPKIIRQYLTDEGYLA